jgi:anthranilate phosphoribosyltransferase
MPRVRTTGVTSATHDDAGGFGEWPLRRLTTEVVGSGTKSAADMTRAQAREAFDRILAGERADGFADAIALNAAFRIYAGGDADTLDEGLATARDVLASGAATDVLAACRER